MRKFILVISPAIKITLFISITSVLFGAQDIYVIPELSLFAPETLLVEWQTPVPTPPGRVYIGEEMDDDFMAQILDFPVVLREKGKKERKEHRIFVRDIEPGKVYRLRVATLDPHWVEIKYSRLYRFKATKFGDKWDSGVVIDLGPFLSLTLGKSYTVFWSTNIPARGEIHLYDKSGNERVFYAREKKAWQEVKLEGLKPGEKYRYRVLVYERDTTKSRTFTFHTIASKGPIRVAVLGDSRGNYHQPSDMAAVNGVNEETLQRILYEVLSESPDLIFVTGDLIRGYTDDTLFAALQYETFLESTWPISAVIPVLPVMGNHDATAPLKESSRRNRIPYPPPKSPEDLWRRYFVTPLNGPIAPPGHPPYLENVYYIDLGEALFVVLNSDYWYRVIEGEKFTQRVDEIQRKWLESVLKTHKGRKTFVFFHEPAYPISKHYGSSLDAHPGARDSLWDVLVKGGVDVVLCGHEHCYGRVLVGQNIDKRWTKPIWEFITGRAGAPLYRKSKHIPYSEEIKAFSLLEHYIIFDISKKGITFETKALSGEVIDRGVLE